MQVQRLRGHLSQALYHAGVIAVSAGGVAGSMEPDRKMNLTTPLELNTNSDSLLLLTALIAIGTQPDFAFGLPADHTERVILSSLHAM